MILFFIYKAPTQLRLLLRLTFIQICDNLRLNFVHNNVPLRAFFIAQIQKRKEKKIMMKLGITERACESKMTSKEFRFTS
jgi:hypothetical protein